MAKNNNLTDFLTDIADTIRVKKGYPTTQKINPQNFSNEILTMNSLEVGDITTADKSGDSNFMLCDGGSVIADEYENLEGILKRTISLNSKAKNSYFKKVAYGNELYVACGTSGKIFTSTDGITWTARTSTTNIALNDVMYANGLWVIVGNNEIMTSSNGLTWTNRISAGSINQQAIAYGNGMWVSVGKTSAYSSSNGVSWTSRTVYSGGSCSLYGVAYGNGLWIACGYYGGVFTSTDGLSWNKIDIGFESNRQLISVFHANGIWLIGGNRGGNSTNAFKKSTNGTMWEDVIIENETQIEIETITYCNGLWVAGKNKIYTSINGEDWEPLGGVFPSTLRLSTNENILIATWQSTGDVGISKIVYKLPQYRLPAYIKVN